ncbi:MAG: hypothetical protein KTR23_08835 [Rhodospirillales bacterium]|nr:hypothetical protein [Rhodospirillales bacterium]
MPAQAGIHGAVVVLWRDGFPLLRERRYVAICGLDVPVMPAQAGIHGAALGLR